MTASATGDLRPATFIMMIHLVQNETLKLIRRRRFAIVMGILIAIIAMVSYGQYRQLRLRKQEDWRANLQQRVARMQNMLRRSDVTSNASWARSVRAEISRMQFYLDRDIEPNKPTAPMFVRGFASAAGILLLPLLVAVLGSDIVSAEHSEGTDKLLLTRPVRRWKILMAKLITLWVFTTVTLFSGAVLAYCISAPFLPARGWDTATFTGFQLARLNLDLASVRELPLWKNILIAYGLEWYALLAVASIALMLSVLFRSSAASIGTMLASLIGGTILTRLTPDWTAGKYLFVTALPLADYWSGEPPPYEGMSMTFCLLLLAGWAVGAIAVAFWRFTSEDVFG